MPATPPPTPPAKTKPSTLLAAVTFTDWSACAFVWSTFTFALAPIDAVVADASASTETPPAIPTNTPPPPATEMTVKSSVE